MIDTATRMRFRILRKVLQIQGSVGDVYVDVRRTAEKI
jgi:hypothetical protein